MAADDSNKGLPIPYVTAVWSGMPLDEIQAGLAAGTILSPLGAPGGWMPNDALAGASVSSEAVAKLLDAAADSPAASHAELAEFAAKDAAGGDARARISGWFQSLDPSLTTEAFDSLWTHAGAGDDARAATLRNYLADTLIGDTSASAEEIDAFVADPGHRTQVVDLSGMTGADIAELAKTDVGYRHALSTLQPLALTGNREIFARANANGALDRFDPDSGEQVMSDAWLGDRAKLLAWKSTATETTTISGSQAWTFVDHTSVDANGDPAKLELRTGTEGAGQNQVVFGSAEGELLQGVSGSDRMYGGDGDDILRGAAGADHLEGGGGDDLVLGGAGNDELAGDRGDDELDGGRGNDRLTAGAGDDILVGGRGNDRLEGGTGRDVYVIDEGDGADTIVDADGLGAIELDGVEVGGTMTAGEQGTWTSADGRLSFAFAGGTGEPGTLTITGRAQGDGDAAISNVITVQNWKNGDLGITLGEGSAASSARGANHDMLAVTAPEVQLLGAEDMVADPQEGEPGNDPSVVDEMNINDAIGWGDVAPVGSGTTMSYTDSSDSPAQGTPESAAPADAQQTGAAQTVAEAPDLDTLQTDWDFSTALDALLSDEAIATSLLQPSDLANAIEAFSGVLEAPDVGAAVVADLRGAEAGGALTAYEYADGVAGEYADTELGGEVGSGMSMPAVPDISTTEFARQIGSGVTGSVRSMRA